MIVGSFDEPVAGLALDHIDAGWQSTHGIEHLGEFHEGEQCIQPEADHLMRDKIAQRMSLAFMHEGDKEDRQQLRIRDDGSHPRPRSAQSIKLLRPVQEVNDVLASNYCFRILAQSGFELVDPSRLRGMEVRVG